MAGSDFFALIPIIDFSMGNPDQPTPKHIVDKLVEASVRGTDGFVFDDPDGLIVWATPDRGVIAVRDSADLAARTPAVVATCRRWVDATRD